VVDGVTGTLVPSGDAAALGAALTRYVESSALRAAHGHAGRDRALREFRRETIWEALHAEYLRLLGPLAVRPASAARVPGPSTAEHPGRRSATGAAS
jgi:hypothetical protein